MFSSTTSTVILSTTMTGHRYEATAWVPVTIKAVLISYIYISMTELVLLGYCFYKQLYKLTLIDHNGLLVVCLFNNLFGSANTNTSATGLGLYRCQV